MRLFKEILIKLGEIIVAVIISMIFFALTTNSNFDEKELDLAVKSLIIGLLASLLFTSIVESLRQKSREDLLEKRFDDMIKVLSGTLNQKSLKFISHYGFLNIPKEKVPSAWTELLWATEEKFWACSFIKADATGWDQNWAKLGFEIQGAKIKAGDVEFKRIYIIEDENEKKNLLEIFDHNLKSGVNFKYITKTAFDEFSDRNASDIVKKNGYDFVIVDNQLVAVVVLDEKRDIKHYKVQWNPNAIKSYTEFYSLLFKQARTPNREISYK